MNSALQIRKSRTLIVGGGFGGAYVARLLGEQGATIVNPESTMLYTPLLPEVAAGAIEPRHVTVPLRMMCPHADVVVGRVTSIDRDAKRAMAETSTGPLAIDYDRVVVALGAVARMPGLPGLAEHALGLKDVGDAIRLRNHVLRKLDEADADPASAARHLTFTFVGAGFAGVEALAELMDLVCDALPHYPRLADVSPRWVLVDHSDQILREVPERLGSYAAAQLARRDVEIRTGTGLESVSDDAVTLSDGSRIETETVVWTAGVRPNPLVSELGLPLDEHGRVTVNNAMRVEGTADVYAIGDCARVPNAANDGAADPPTCQHVLRQARRLAKNLSGDVRPYRYRSLGQAATLGRDKGIANVMGMNLRGLPGSVFTRWYHMHQLPLLSRKLRVLTDGSLSNVFGRDMAPLAPPEPQPAT
jgi:NADH:ubiquinone reductase (H+-translocating)